MSTHNHTDPELPIPRSAIPNPQSAIQPESAVPAIVFLPETQNPPLISPLATTPPSLAQPSGQIPIVDRYGSLIAWTAQSGFEPDRPFPGAISYENRRGHTICWLEPRDPDFTSGAPEVRRGALLNSCGQVIDWVGDPDATAAPTPTARKLRSNWTTFAWLDESLPIAQSANE